MNSGFLQAQLKGSRKVEEFVEPIQVAIAEEFDLQTLVADVPGGVIVGGALDDLAFIVKAHVAEALNRIAGANQQFQDRQGRGRR